MWPIFFVRLYLSKSPHRGWGLVAPLLYKVICLSTGGKLKIFRMGIHSVSFSVVGLYHVPIWNFGVISAQTESAASIPFPKSQGSLSGQSPLLRLIKCRSKLISLLLPTLFLDLLFCQNHFLFNLNIPHKKIIAITIVWDAVQCWSVSPHVKASHGIYLKWLVIQHNIIRPK